GQETAPRVRHAPAETIEVQAGLRAGMQEFARRSVERESIPRGLLEHAPGDQMPQHARERFGMRAARRREFADLARAAAQLLRDLEGGDDVHAPRRREIAQLPPVRHAAHFLFLRPEGSTRSATLRIHTRASAVMLATVSFAPGSFTRFIIS